jgi:hypothetical protein
MSEGPVGNMVYLLENQGVIVARDSLGNVTLLLHRNLNPKSLARPTDFKLIERQAHRFSAAFLLPMAPFADDFFAASLDTLRAIKPRWRVSIAMMIMRARDGDLISDEAKRRMFINYSRRRWQRSEPLDDTLEAETFITGDQSSSPASFTIRRSCQITGKGTGFTCQRPPSSYSVSTANLPDNLGRGSPFNRSSAGQRPATNSRTNRHFGAMTSTNVGQFPRRGPLRWRAQTLVITQPTPAVIKCTLYRVQREPARKAGLPPEDDRQHPEQQQDPVRNRDRVPPTMLA